MKLQKIAASVGVALINYGEETQARYEVKITNNVGNVDVVYLRSKNDVSLVVRELIAQDATKHAEASHFEGANATLMRYINYPNQYPNKTTLGTCRKAANATPIEQIVKDYNATHSQVLTVHRQK